MNLLTFDIEEWALAKVGGYGNPAKYAEYDSFLDRILNLLDETKTKGTFFCTGQMAEFFPDVVKRIQSNGHEIGCHSYLHSWMNKMGVEEAWADTRKAVDLLEQCIGDKIVCYRAPAFSIGENNKWMFEVLAENGITSDASVFPCARDFGGFPGFPVQKPCVVDYKGTKIKEYPICVTVFLGKRFAYSGGGYFRFFPFRFIKNCIAKNDYSMCYFHINDLMPEMNTLASREDYEAYYMETGTLKNRCIRYVKSNIGKSGAWHKLERLVSDIRFISIRDVSDEEANRFPVVFI